MSGSERLTIQLPSELVERVRSIVRREGGTVSEYVANAVVSYARRDALRTLLDELDAEHGAPSAEERRWAEKVLARDPSVRHRVADPAPPSGHRPK